MPPVRPHRRLHRHLFVGEQSDETVGKKEHRSSNHTVRHLKLVDCERVDCFVFLCFFFLHRSRARSAWPLTSRPTGHPRPAATAVFPTQNAKKNKPQKNRHKEPTVGVVRKREKINIRRRLARRLPTLRKSTDRNLFCFFLEKLSRKDESIFSKRNTENIQRRRNRRRR